MPLAHDAIVIDAATFAHLRAAIETHVGSQAHLRGASPSSLTVYLNSLIGPSARQPENGTDLISWMHDQGTQDVRFRLDALDRHLTPPQCAFVLTWD